VPVILGRQGTRIKTLTGHPSLRLRPLSLGTLLILPHAGDECTLHPDAAPVPVEDEGNWYDQDFDRAEKSPCPIGTEGTIQGRAGEGQGAAEDGADERVAGHGGGGVYSISVNEVAGGVDEDGGVAGAEGNAGSDGNSPVDRGRDAGPGKPEFANGAEDRCDADDRHCGFGRGLGGGGIGVVAVDHAANEGLAADSDQAANANSNKGQARETDAPASDLLEDDRVGYETEVEKTCKTIKTGNCEAMTTYPPYMIAMYKFQKMQIGSRKDMMMGLLRLTFINSQKPSRWS
jgi:hypothetical protein